MSQDKEESKKDEEMVIEGVTLKEALQKLVEYAKILEESEKKNSK